MINKKIISILFFIVIFISTNIIIFKHLNNEKEAHLHSLKEMIINEAEILFETIIATKEWNSQYQGVFVRKKEGLEPNPYLIDNQLLTKDGESLIKINHTWMTKQISQISNNINKHTFNITSLKPLNPKNAPNSFEKEALTYFNNSNKKFYNKFSEDFENLKFMGALKADNKCLTCHYSQNYKIGDIVGGISINIPTKKYRQKYILINENYQDFINILSMFLILFFIIMVYLIYTHFNKKEVLIKNLKELEKLKDENETLVKRYKYALEASQIGIWDWDLVTNKVYFDKNWKEMLGFSNEELASELSEWDKRVHPDDKEQAIKDIKDNQNKKTNAYINIHRLKHKNGNWVWIFDKGKTYFDKDGNAIRMIGSHTNITQLKELELELQENEQNLAYSQEIAHMGNWKYYPKEDKFIISDTLKKLVGLNSLDANFTYDKLRALIHKDDLKDFIKQHKIALNSYKKTNLQYRLKKVNSDEYIDINEYISCLSPSKNNEDKIYLGSIQNITHLKNLEKDLTLFSTIINNSPLSIIITNPKGDIIYVNPYFTKVSGYKKSEVMGENPRILKSPLTDLRVYKDLWKTITNKKTWGGIFRNLTKDKKEYWETALIIPIIDEKNEIINFLAIKREITKEVFLRKELEEKEEMMLNQSKNAAMGEMISMIAHQWRQPITTISMAANNILADIELEIIDNQETERFAHEIATQTQYLSQTIEDFRNFFKQDKEKENISIKTIFDDTLTIISASLKNNDIELNLNFDKNITITTYRRELVQIIINIIKNAKEALQETENESKYINVDILEYEDKIQIKIEDNAGGIKEENIDKIFEPYFTTKNEQNGTGLGLYMSKMIIEKHLNGNIEVLNENDGAVFKIILPKKRELSFFKNI